VLAAEESHGVIVVPTIRDKDATPACMYLAALYQKLYRKKQTLLDYYIHILEEFGGGDIVNRSIMMSGAEGMLKKNRILESLRQSPPQSLGGQPVRKIVDYWDQKLFGPFVSQTDRLPRNVLQIFTDALVVTVRPSGTEPKLKFYCQLLPAKKPSAARGTALLSELRTIADQLARRIYNDLLSRIGLSVDEAALLLPDIVDLDCKQNFEQKVVPQLRQALADERFASLNDVLAWLRRETASMTPGADPLPALKAPVAYLLTHQFRDLSSRRPFQELETWAKQH
jgi:phosphomannomutase